MPAKNIAVRIALVGSLLLLAAAPIVYQYFASVVALKPGFGGAATALDLASAPESASGPVFVLAYASLASQSAREGNYTEAKRLLGMTGKLPPNIEHDLRTYVTLMNEFVLILDSLQSQLDKLQGFASDGAVAQAREMIRGIEELIADGSRRLDLLFSSLDRIRGIYRVDISTQEHDLNAFSSTLLSFEGLLSSLKMQVEAIDPLAAARLDLTVSPDPVQIDESLQIVGQLRNGSIGLNDRIVELWINGIEIANLTTNQLGMFDWQYLVSDTRVDRIEVYARYSPSGNDISRFRPARSTTVGVLVNYYPALLTITPISKRVLVLENFTVQGYLADSFGRALPGQTVDLLVDGRQLNSSKTETGGKYSITTSLAAGTLEGEHQMYTRFEPKQGIYASTESDKTSIQLYYLKPDISQLALTGVVVVRGEPIAASGQKAQLEGRLEVDSQPFEQGLVIAFLEGNELGRGLSQGGGVFRFPIEIPYDVSGDSKIEIAFIPAKPWVAFGTESVVLRVLNSAVLGLGIGAAVFAVLVFSGKPIDPHSILLRRAAPGRRPKAETIVVEERARTAPTLLSLSDSSVELDLALKLDQARAYVKTAYWDIRRILAGRLSLRGETSETPREFALRAAEGLGDAASSLSAITLVFEIAEYSQHVISRAEAQEARDHAFGVIEEVKVRMKH